MNTFSSLFWITLGIIFASAIIGTIVKRRQRDRCLKLLDDFHVTLEMVSGEVIWGDVHVYPQGLEVAYDAPYATKLGVVKSGYLLYEPELANMLALVRYIGDLTPEERRQRAEQVQKRFRPDAFRRGLRSFRNMVNTVRDAFGQALGMVIGQVTKANKSLHTQALQSRQGDIDSLGKTLINVAGNAWEPMLERRLGQPVVLELTNPRDPEKRRVELPGYLAEYSEKFIALFNVEQPIASTITVAVDAPSIERDDLTVSLEEHKLVVTNLHDVPLVVAAVDSDLGAHRRLDVVLTHGASARVARLPGELTLTLLRVTHVDMVCPRAHATVRYASLDALPTEPDEAMPPVHEDQSVSFP